MRKLTPSLLALAAGFLSPSLQAHHGLDFLDVQTSRILEQNDLYFAVRSDFIEEEHEGETEREWEFEPTLIYGVTDWLSAELHAHFEDERGDGESPEHESTAPAVNIRFTPRDAALTLGLYLEYEIAAEDDDRDEAIYSLNFSYEAEHALFAANLGYEDEQGDGESGFHTYALGARTGGHAHAWGVELQGIESVGFQEAALGYYGEFTERFSFNAAVGFGINDSDTDYTVKTALIFKFN